MTKRKNRTSVFKKIMIVYLAFMIFIPSIFTTGALTVLADESEEVEETEEEKEVEAEDITSDIRSVAGNIYNIGKDGDGTTQVVMEKAAEYDIRMQYLVTYAFLSDKYGNSNARSKYNQIYYGSQKGYSDSLNIQSSPESLYNVMQGDDDDSGSPHDKDPTKSTKELNENMQEATKDLANAIGNEIANAVTGAVGTTKEERDLTSRGGLAMGVSEGLEMTVRNFDKVFEVDDIDAYKKEVRRKNVGDADAVVYMAKEYSKLISQDLLGVPLTEDEIKESTERTTTYANLQMLVDKYRGKKLDELGKKNVSYRVDVEGNNKNISLNFKGVNIADAKEADIMLTFVPEYVKVIKRKDKELSNEKIQSVVSDQLKKAVEDVVNSDVNGLVTKYLNAANEMDRINEEILGNIDPDVAILSWLPIYPAFDIEEIERSTFFGTGGTTDEILNDVLKDLEGSEYRDERVYTSENNRRTIRLNDLFYSKGSASPILTLDTEATNNNYAKYIAGWDQSVNEGTSLGKYAGIKTIDLWDDNKLKYLANIVGNINPLNGLFFKDWEFQKNVMHKHNPDEDSYNVKMARSLAAENDEYEIQMDVEKAQFIGIDTYGNIINATTGTILIPYWQNETVTELNIDGSNDTGIWASHAAYTDASTVNVISDLVNGDDSVILENTISQDDIKDAFGKYLPSGTRSISLPEPINVNKIHSLVTNGGQQGQIDQEAIHALAVKIVAGTHKDVKAWNEAAIERGRDSGELFIETNVGEYSGDNATLIDGYTNADLRERIMMILDYGFYEVLKSTIASLIVAIYNSGFIHFTMSAVFHTTTLADTAIWDDLIRSAATILIGFLGMYTVIMAFHVFRRTMRVKDFITQFLIVTFIILIPSVIYAPAVNLIINKPTPLILGQQLQQMSILEQYMHDKENDMERDPVYAQLFGGNVETRDKTQDYKIDFYTTQHKSGFFVDSALSEEGLSFRDRVRSSRADLTGEWNKNDLVKVSVSVFDLNDWVKMRVDASEENKTTETLFEWLANNPETSHRYLGIREYDEFSYDPNRINKNLGILGNDTNLERLTASDLYLAIYEASSPVTNDGRNLSERLTNMITIADVAKNEDHLNPVSMEEINAFIRDLSLTRDGRRAVFGTTDLTDYNVSKVTVTTPDISGTSLELWQRVGRGETLTIANSDYLNLESIMDRVKPETGDPREIPNDRHIYKVNEKTLNDYINVQSIVRETVGETVRDSEFMAITLNVFFNLNKELELPMFPTNIRPETISLDTFARMVYIPIIEYNTATTSGTDNLAEYLTLRDNPILLLFTFIPALVALTAWGLIYLVVFGVIVMVLSVTMFIWNYVIKRDMTNKSWFGTLMIILAFGLAKIGLLGLWFVMSYWMNNQTSLFGGSTYLYSVVHSLAILLYVYFALKFLISKVLKPVAKSPMDLGGQQMMDGITGTLSREERMKRREQRRAKGNPTNEGKKAIDEALESEGEEGQVDLDGVGSPIRRVVNKLTGRDAGVADDISEALSEQNSPELNKYAKHTRGFGGKAKRVMYGAFEAIPAIANLAGAAPELIETLSGTGSVGQVLSTTADGVQLAKMAIGNVSQATRVAEHLSKQGINAKVNDNGDVVFDTTDTDLNSPEVRKSIYGELTNDLLTEIDELPEVKLSEEENPLAYNTNEDGTNTLTVGATGLSTKNLDEIMNSKVFTDSFIVEDVPAKDENGEYIQGALEVVARDGVDANAALRKIFSLDEKMRTSSGEEARSILAENRSFEYEGLSSNEEVISYMEDGMRLQEDKILYDVNNRKHRRAIKKMQSVIDSEISHEEYEKKELMDRLIAQTVYGGDAGVQMEYVNTSQDEQVLRDAKSAGLVTEEIRTAVYAGENEGRVAEQIMTVKNLSNLTDTEIGQYYTSQDQLFRAGDSMLVQGEGKDRYDKALNKLSVMGRTAGASETIIEQTMEKYKELGNKRDNAELLPDEYEQEVEGLYADLQLSLQDEGVYAKAISTEINKNDKAPKEAKDALNKYVKSKRNLMDKGVSVDVVEKLDQEQFTELSEMLGDIKDVKVKGDGVINVESEGRIDEQDMSRLIQKMKELDKEIDEF